MAKRLIALEFSQRRALRHRISPVKPIKNTRPIKYPPKVKANASERGGILSRKASALITNPVMASLFPPEYWGLVMLFFKCFISTFSVTRFRNPCFWFAFSTEAVIPSTGANTVACPKLGLVSNNKKMIWRIVGNIDVSHSRKRCTTLVLFVNQLITAGSTILGSYLQTIQS